MVWCTMVQSVVNGVVQGVVEVEAPPAVHEAQEEVPVVPPAEVVGVPGQGIPL